MNKNKLVNTNNIKLAKVKYFDVEHNGVEVAKEDPYVFLYKLGDTYVNLFDPIENLPVYSRVPYSNTTRSGEDFGSKIVLTQGETKNGLCYVMENVEVKKLFNKDIISVSDLMNYMIHSEKFFLDRKDFLLNSSIFKVSRKVRAKYYSDLTKTEDFEYFVNSHNKNKELIKL